MAITIASANAALARNGLDHIELIKTNVGEIALAYGNGGEVEVICNPEGPVTRIRDTTIAEVLNTARRVESILEARRLRVASEPAKPLPIESLMRSGDLPELRPAPPILPVTDKEATIQMAMHSGVVFDEKVLTDGFVDEPNIYDDSVKYLYPNVARVSHLKPESVVLGSHNDRRSKGPNTTSHTGYRPEPKSPKDQHPPSKSHGWDMPTVNGFRKLANDANAEFIEKHLADSRMPGGVEVYVQRSGSILCRSGECAASVKVTDLVGSRFMRDRSPSWWRTNISNIAEGRPVIEDGIPLNPARVRALAGEILAYKTANRKKVVGNGYAYAVLHHNGTVTFHYRPDLREAFALINVGERVFIPSADLGRYDREVRDGKHGDPRGLHTL